MWRIGLIDVDGHHFPNLPLMKLSAWHKMRGDEVNWYDHLQHWNQRMYDKVYMSKVFTFTMDYPYSPNAREVIRGGTGYFYPDGGEELDSDVEHMYPDYALYPQLCKDTAYGFLTRGCPRGCGFCVVASKEGSVSRKAANLSEFWRGQKYICLLDPNLIACQDWMELLEQLVDSRSWIDFTQGIDIRIMTPQKAEAIKKVKTKNIHFAWDRYEDKDMILPRFRLFKEVTGWDSRKMTVYVLCGWDTTLEQDLERIYILRDMGYSPYVMIYNKSELPKSHVLKRLQRWVNSRYTFAACKKFEDYYG